MYTRVSRTGEIMDKDDWFRAAHSFIAYFSDHILAVAVGLWLFVPALRDIFGIIGAIGAVVLVVGRNYGMWLDNKASKLRLKRLEQTTSQENFVDLSEDM